MNWVYFQTVQSHFVNQKVDFLLLPSVVFLLCLVPSLLLALVKKEVCVEMFSIIKGVTTGVAILCYSYRLEEV